MGDIFSLARKLERAVRNDTGVNVTKEEMRAMVDGGIFGQIHALKIKELEAKCLARPAHTQSANTGSTSGATALPPMSGRSPDTPVRIGASGIKALVAGR
jgi:hypothetical protein